MKRVSALLFSCSLACTTSVESVTSYPVGGSSVTVPLEGYVPTSVEAVRIFALQSLNKSVSDPTATWVVDGIYYPNDDSSVSSGGTEYYHWSGGVSGLGSSVWPQGGVARLQVRYSTGPEEYIGYTFDDLSCLSRTGGSFADRAEACESHVSGNLYLVDEAPVAAATREYLSLRETPLAEASQYYGRIDLFGVRATLEGFKSANGFNAGATGYEPVVNARYYNAQDLGLGRDMNCIKKTATNQLACYVTNYGDAVAPAPGDDPDDAVEAAIARTASAQLATVAMEYRLNDPANPVTFYVYDANGNRVSEVALDSEGPKAVPGVCLACHGGTYNPTTNSVTNAHFLPFDLQNFHFSSTSGFRRVDQEDELRALNRLVSLAKPTQAITDQLLGWYGTNLGVTGRAQDDDYVPAGWLADPVLYREVARPYCRGCHLALAELRSDARDFDMLADLQAYSGTVKSRVCDAPDMPHAEITREKFWGGPARGHLVGALDLATACKGTP